MNGATLRATNRHVRRHADALSASGAVTRDEALIAAIAEALKDLPPLLTPEEAAKFLRRSTRTLRRLESLGLLRVLRVAGGRPLIARDELKRLLTESAA